MTQTYSPYRHDATFLQEHSRTFRLAPNFPRLAAEMLGASPENVLLVGIVGQHYEPGEPLSDSVRTSVSVAIGAVIQELDRLGFEVERRADPSEPGIWWSEPEPVEEVAECCAAS